jgi:hypothetical protein
MTMPDGDAITIYFIHSDHKLDGYTIHAETLHVEYLGEID